MIAGTLFLWLCWPAFNAADFSQSDEEQLRALVNTYLSLTASTVATFCISVMVTPQKKFDMVHIQNSTLAGGVAVGAVANLMIHPFGAILIGFASAVISVLGYTYLTVRKSKLLK